MPCSAFNAAGVPPAMTRPQSMMQTPSQLSTSSIAVRGDDDGEVALAPQLPDIAPDGAARLRIEADGGLVEEQDAAVVDEGAGDLQAPLHARGERAHERVAQSG